MDDFSDNLVETVDRLFFKSGSEDFFFSSNGLNGLGLTLFVISVCLVLLSSLGGCSEPELFSTLGENFTTGFAVLEDVSLSPCFIIESKLGLESLKIDLLIIDFVVS